MWMTQYKIRQRETSNILRCTKRKHIHNLIREANQDYAGQKNRNIQEHKYFKKESQANEKILEEQ